MFNVEERPRAAVTAAAGQGGQRRAEALVSPLARQENFRPLVEWFVRGLELRLEAIEQAWRTAAWPELATLAHQLKGAGASYGYPTISEAAKQVEHAAKAEEHHSIEPLFEALREQCDAAARGLA